MNQRLHMSASGTWIVKKIWISGKSAYVDAWLTRIGP